MAIKRIWHGWTTRDNADSYQSLLHSEVLPGIEAKKIPGYRDITVLRQEQGDEVEFVTIMTFDSIQNVIDFQGEDYRRCYVPDAAQEVLRRWDQTSEHYEVVEFRKYGYKS
jgi:antibiotic biosynthesis monooxygenase (ABM) superfamily enzyme